MQTKSTPTSLFSKLSPPTDVGFPYTHDDVLLSILWHHRGYGSRILIMSKLRVWDLIKRGAWPVWPYFARQPYIWVPVPQDVHVHPPFPVYYSYPVWITHTHVGTAYNVLLLVLLIHVYPFCNFACVFRLWSEGGLDTKLIISIQCAAHNWFTCTSI